MPDFALILIVVVTFLGLAFVCVRFIKNRNKKESNESFHNSKVLNISAKGALINDYEETATAVTALLSGAGEIEITNRSGDKLSLSRVNTSNALSKRKYQEIIARGSAMGSGLIQGGMPVLAQAQTLAQIAKAAPNGLFASTGPVSELIKYSDGTIGSIVMKNGRMINHTGFKEIALNASLNPAIAIAIGMQAMAMISGQYYMHNISEQLKGIERGIDKLIGFHHDQNIGRLRSIENTISGVVDKKLVDETDIISLQAGIGDADSILMEYLTRLERISETGELTGIQVRKLWSRISAAKELKSLHENTKEQELVHSFQICLFASKLMNEAKKAEFATRMKMGQTEKATEVFNSYKQLYAQSFFVNATDYLDNIYNPINAKAESLVEGQWVKSKRTLKVQDSIENIKDTLNDYICTLTENKPDEDLINSFCENREILFLPASENSEQRVFISVEDNEPLDP